MGSQAQFDKLLQDIEPSPTSKSVASSAHRTLRKYLAEHEDFCNVHLDTFLAGSYRRNTAIRPRIVNGESCKPDIDIIVETNYTLDADPKDVLKLLREVLGQEYELDDHINDRSVGVKTAAVDMDVVPIIAPEGTDGPLYLPDRRLEKWLRTNPPGHTEWATQVNDDTDGRFKPMVKLIKWWRRHHARSKRPKGFMIETIVAECMDRDNDQYPTLFVGTLEKIVSKYSINYLVGSVPQIADPSVPGNIVTKRLSVEDFKLFYEEAKKHAELGRKALNEKDREKADEMWKEILPRMPSYGKAATSESLLTTAAAAPALVFPDRPITPQKPGGFA